MHRTKTIGPTLAMLACLAAPAQAQMYPGQDANSEMLEQLKDPGVSAVPSARALPPEPEARGEELRLSGHCPQAIPIFRQLANLGSGYEIAEYNLGLCLYDVAKLAKDPQTAQTFKSEGAGWLLKAANSSFPRAQGALVAIYLDGDGVPADPIAAGKWSLIYHANDARRALALPDTKPDLKARLDNALNDKAWAQAQAQADAFVPAPVNNGVADR